MPDDPTASIHFPDVPKLELDQLIDQLVERAQDVKHAQGRLRGLVRGIGTIAGELSLEAVLRNIVEAACTLVGARYGALGVVGPNGGLEQFLHVGLDGDAAARIGHLPEGKGLLGALITEPQTIRLAHMSDDERSAGVPAGHPRMDSFLGVPIRVGGEIYGNLYLTDSMRGAFTREDEELVVALAAAAASAIGNARMYQESRLQQNWLSASVDIGSQLLASAGEDPLRMIARRALDIASADFVSLGLVSEDGAHLVVEQAFGTGAQTLVGTSHPLEDTVAGEIVRTGHPLLRPAPDELAIAVLGDLLDPGPLMILPLQGASGVRGVLSLVRVQGRSAFTAADLEMAAGFAGHASVALELADSRAAEQRVVLLEDRDRIARDLHDHVIQELFAIGMSLESIAGQLREDLGTRLRQRVDDLDRTIRRIRTSIFALSGPLDHQVDSLRRRVLEIASDLTPALGFPPHVTFAGIVDLALPPELGDDVAAAVRESLTNVAKHAGATRVDLDLSVHDTLVTLVVDDDGRGLGAPQRSSGLSNLRVRAERHGGTLIASAAGSGGTRITWTAHTERGDA